MGEFRMPALGADMTEGTLVEWLVQPGDTVTRGQPIAVVDTAKSAIEVECFEDGVVGRLLVELNTTVPVGTPLAEIGPVPAAGPPEPAEQATARRGRQAGAGTRAPAESDAAPPAADHPHPPDPVSPLIRRLARERGLDPDSIRGTGTGGRVTRADLDAAGPPPAPRRVRATPYARRVAAELGVDITTVSGSGARGAVLVRDVRAARSRAGRSGAGPAGAEAAEAERREPPAPEPPTRAPAPSPPEPSTPEPPAPRDAASAMRGAVAALMTRSKHEIPHYYLSTTIDLSKALAWMRDHNRAVPVAERLVPAALLLKAAAVAARAVPEMNGFWLDGRHAAAPSVHLGVAVALRGGGLVAPALHDADQLTVPELMAALRDLVARARAGRLRSSETADPTITVTDLGDQGVEAVFGVIYPPQVALVGFGRVGDRPTAVDGLVGARPAVTATLSADHRASDGAAGARYLALVDRLLQRPEDL